MNKLPRFVSKQIGKLVSLNSLLKLNTPVFQPFYHVVSNEKLPHILNYNYRNVSQFEKELDFYLKYFSPVSLQELVTTKNSDRKIFHLSFDDGLKECFEIIAPVLHRKGVPATFFINTGFVDNQRLFHKYKASLILNRLNETSNPKVEHYLKERNLSGFEILKASFLQENILDEAAVLLGLNFNDFLEKQKPYLTTGQILKLKSDGFSIGAHSFSHLEFWGISQEKQIEEIKTSMNWLVENINPKIRAFSFPFTDSGVSLKVFKALRTENICDVTFGTAGIKFDELEYHFQRYPVEKQGNFLLNLKEEFVYFALRKIIGKATVKH